MQAPVQTAAWSGTEMSGRQFYHYTCLEQAKRPRSSEQRDPTAQSNTVSVTSTAFCGPAWDTQAGLGHSPLTSTS